MRVTEDVRTLMRDADPAPREATGGERAQADLERILRMGHLDAVDGRQREREVPLPRRDNRLVPWLAGVAAGAAVAVAFAVLPADDPAGSGYAATPPPLRYEHVGTTVPAATLLARLADRVAELEEPAGPVSRVRQREWALDTRVHADGSVTSDVAETEYRRVVRADGTGATERTDEDGNTETYPLDGADLAPDDPAAFRSWLADRPGDVDFGDPMGAHQITAELLRHQALVPAQRAELLRALAGLPGLRFDGEVTDRAGRAGQAFSAESSAGGLPARFTFVVDPGTGAVLGREETLTETAGELNVPVPSVIGYEVYLSAERTS